MDYRRVFGYALACAGSLLLAACSIIRPSPEEAQVRLEPASTWHAMALPGKRSTLYAPKQHEGRPAIHARADRSASVWRRAWAKPAHELRDIRFSWWVPSLLEKANLTERDGDDAPVRLVLAFDGDHGALSARNRLLFDLAESLSGERPPYATLMYVWEPRAPVGSVIINSRTDRIRKIVVESGPANLKQWRDYRRNVADDFRRAFGEEPGPLLAVAYMTDSDNTHTKAEAWYGEVHFD